MQTTDQTSENQKKLLPSTPEESPSESPPENPYKSINLWKRLSHAILAFVLSYFAFLYFSQPSSPPQAKRYIEAYLTQITNISMEMSQKVIQGSSLHDQSFPLLVSQRIQGIKPPSEASVDLLCVFDFSGDRGYKYQTELIGYLLKMKILPSMNNQDRLSVVLLDCLSSDGQILSITPFTNISSQNPEEILSTIGENFMRGEKNRVREEPKAAMRVLDQRDGPKQATGVFFWTYFHERNLGGLENLKRYFGLEDQSVMIREFPIHYILEYGDWIAESLKVLRTGVIESQFVIKPEDSRILKGIEVINPSQKEMTRGWRKRPIEENKLVLISNGGLNLGLQEGFLLDVKIPRIERIGSFREKFSMEVKVASCQQTFKLVDEGQVVRNFDLIMRIVEEGGEFIDEKEEKRVTKEFERRVGGDWLPFLAMILDENGDETRFEALRRFWRV